MVERDGDRFSNVLRSTFLTTLVFSRAITHRRGHRALPPPFSHTSLLNPLLVCTSALQSAEVVIAERAACIDVVLLRSFNPWIRTQILLAVVIATKEMLEVLIALNSLLKCGTK